MGNLHLSTPQPHSTTKNYFEAIVSHRYYIITPLYLFLTIMTIVGTGYGQKSKILNFAPLVDEIQKDLLILPPDSYAPPTEKAFRDFDRAVRSLRARSLDSCERVLAKYHYRLAQVTDAKTGAVYDVIKEIHPAHTGWGTFIFNRHYKKRLIIEIDHPADDGNTLTIGFDLFRHTRAAWLLIAGTGKRAGDANGSSDVARASRSLFQQFHEGLTDLTFMSISIHAFGKKFYEAPISGTDIVLSNGRTTDDQWGISQISLDYRDSLQNAGFSSRLAMYDAGFDPLAGGTNRQGIFSNDSVGFGHWINIDLSNTLRESPAEYSRFIAVTDRALDLSGGKIAQLLNRAFGLVTPRAVRINSIHPMNFSPSDPRTYRIISYNAAKAHSDTVNLRVGQWMDVFKSENSASAVKPNDTLDDQPVQEPPRPVPVGIHTSVANIVDPATDIMSSIVQLRQKLKGDSSLADPEMNPTLEPLQVHRIPLQPIVALEGTDQNSSIGSDYRWSGVVHAGFSSSIPVFQISTLQPDASQDNVLPNFLIPIIRNSYSDGQSKFIGIQMTKFLVEEIARLVGEQQNGENDVSLLAEESADGDYFLRVFPADASGANADAQKER